MNTATQWTLTQAQLVIEVVAILAFALSGLIQGTRRQLDVVGLFVAAGLTAFGGGTLRDVLLDRRPFFWVQHAQWIWVLAAMCAIAMLFLRGRQFHLTERAMQWPDALGLGLFTASGTQIALAMQMPAVVAVLMGVMSAVVGGVLRDIAVNELPAALADHRPYALCALIGGWVLVGAQQAGFGADAALALSAGVTVLLRVAALLSGWQLPRWHRDPPAGDRR